MVTKELEKGKGVVFGYEPKGGSNSLYGLQVQGEKLMASAIKANPLIGWRPEFSHREVNPFDIPQSSNSSSSISGSTDARLKSFDLNVSGTSVKKMSVRKRPGKTRGMQKLMLVRRITFKYL